MPNPSPQAVYLALGSNIEPETNLPAALQEIIQQFDVVSVSAVWESPAVGASAPNFLNAAISCMTAIPEATLALEFLRPIEAKMGRVRTKDKNAPRTIDLDILVVGESVVDASIWQYAHLAVPLAEIHPGLLHPETGQSIAEKAKLLEQKVSIHRRDDIDLRPYQI